MEAFAYHYGRLTCAQVRALTRMRDAAGRAKKIHPQLVQISIPFRASGRARVHPFFCKENFAYMQPKCAKMH